MRVETYGYLPNQYNTATASERALPLLHYCYILFTVVQYDWRPLASLTTLPNLESARKTRRPKNSRVTAEVLTWYSIRCITTTSRITRSSCRRQKSSSEAAKRIDVNTGTSGVGPRGLSNHLANGGLTTVVMAMHHVTVLHSCSLRISPLQQEPWVAASFIRSIRRTRKQSR